MPGTSGERGPFPEAFPKIQEKYEIPLVFHDIMIKMLEKDPANRYTSVMELFNDLQNSISENKHQKALNIVSSEILEINQDQSNDTGPNQITGTKDTPQ